MRIDCPAALARRREAMWCCYCGKLGPVDPHHCFTVATGRIDADWNLASICRACHGKNHNGEQPMNAELLDLVAKRCFTTPQAITEAVHFVRRQDKDATSERLKINLRELSREAKMLVRAALSEVGKL